MRMNLRAGLPLGCRPAVFGFYVLATVLYLGWRAALTINREYPLYSWVFLLAESFLALFGFCFYALLVRPSARREVLPVPISATVDVFIATYNEELSLLRTTVVAARDMDHPHRTWLCDDGQRPEVAALARELEVGYITRPRNTHYKSGNLNNAIAHTDGEFFVILDSDHVPCRGFLTRLLSYFQDPQVALVQTPQVYYNVDSFQHVLSIQDGRLWHESAVFHHGIVPGLDQRDAAIFLGTGAVCRRSALAAVNGIATGSITEDVLTSMRLHAAGYRTVFVDEPLAFLLAPDTPLSYAQQRLRWAQGNLQILRTESPLTKPGLSLWQRIGYLNTFASYLTAYCHLLFYVAPALFLLLGVGPMVLPEATGVPLLTGYIVLSLCVYKLMAAPYASIFYSECYKMLNLPIFLRASLALLRPQERAFKVTPKGKHGGLPLLLLAPIAGICALNVTAVGFGLSRLLQGDAGSKALLLAMGWALFLGLTAAFTLLHAFERRMTDELFACPVSFNAAVAALDSQATAITRVKRLSHECAYIKLAKPRFPIATKVSLDLSFIGLTEPVKAVVSTAISYPGRARFWLLRLSLLELSAAQRDMLDRYLFNVALPALFSGLETNAPRWPAADAAVSYDLTPVIQPYPLDEFLRLRSTIL